MPLRSAVTPLKLFTWRLFCMVLLRLSAGSKGASAGRSAPSQAPTAAPARPKKFPCHSAPAATAIDQPNVIRIYTCQRQSLVQKGRAPTRPPTNPSGNTRASPAQEGNSLAKDYLFLAWQERRRTAADQQTDRETKVRQRRLYLVEAFHASRRIPKARNCRGFLTSDLCRQSFL
jgi:hypothetical protein